MPWMRQYVVLRLVITDIMLVVAIGIAAGTAGGLAVSRFVSTLLFEVKPSAFSSLALPLLCLLLAAAVAGLPPALRAARVDPLVALRED
jgi:putative ABC transport system permease protein